MKDTFKQNGLILSKAAVVCQVVVLTEERLKTLKTIVHRLNTQTFKLRSLFAGHGCYSKYRLQKLARTVNCLPFEPFCPGKLVALGSNLLER